MVECTAVPAIQNGNDLVLTCCDKATSLIARVLPNIMTAKPRLLFDFIRNDTD